MTTSELNPFRPGAGHSPPHLAGRQPEVDRFKTYLHQDPVIKNVVLTGLRGVGKTVLMDDRFKPEAQAAEWAWVGSDFSEGSFLNETNLCTRLITDLAVFTGGLAISEAPKTLGFNVQAGENRTLSFDFLVTFFQAQPGLLVDKLKAVLEFVWAVAAKKGVKGIVFAYDEAQVVADQKQKDQYPLTILLETFQSLQRKGAKYLLLLTGLPTLFPKLVESRTYAERMFDVQEISRLTPTNSIEAITVPLKNNRWRFTDDSIRLIVEASDGYPYFIQFICREALDYLIQTKNATSVPIDPIIRKLDCSFFAGRWELLTDRQRDLCYCIAQLNLADGEFAIPDIEAISKTTARQIKIFSKNDISQILPRLIEKGHIYKNRYGKYCFAVPLFGRFVNRKYDSQTLQKNLFE